MMRDDKSLLIIGLIVNLIRFLVMSMFSTVKHHSQVFMYTNLVAY